MAMRRTIALWVSTLCVLLLSMAKVYAAEVTFVGNYTHQGKPAIIVQFDEKINSKNLATIQELPKKTSSSASSNASEKSTDWIFNGAKNALIYDQVSVNQRYKVIIAKDVETLVSREQEVTIFEREPQVSLVGRGPVVPAKGSRTLPITAVNAEQVSVEVLQVTDPSRLLHEMYYQENVSPWGLNRMRKSYQSVTTLNFELPRSAVNQDVQTAITLPKELKDGWYIVVMKVAGDFNSSNYTIAHVLLTDIGVQAKVFKKQLNVQLSSLSTGKAIRGATAFILQKDQKRVELGGMPGSQHQFDYDVQTGDSLVIQYNNQYSLLPLKEVPLDLSGFKVIGREWQEVEAFAYSNRNLFKPGELLPLNIVLRDKDGEALPKQRLFVEYVKPDGQISTSRWLTESDATGFYQDHFSIPKGAPLGRWSANIKHHKDAKQTLNQFSFNVSEFVPERMDLMVDVASGVQTKTESLPVNLEGMYLFGAPASGNKVGISSLYQPQNHFEGPYKDFFVGDAFSISHWRDVPDTDAVKLDENGKKEMSLPLIKQSLLKSPVLTRFNFELFETGGATVQRNKQFMLWTGQPLAGILPTGEEVPSYSQAEFGIGLLDGKGEALLSGKVSYLLERNRGGYYWTYSESDGWQLQHDNEWQPVVSDSVTLTEGKASSILLDVDWGSYRLTATTEAGLVTRYSFWAGWGASEELQPAKPDQLSMSLDKTHYQDGDTAVVTIQSDVTGSLFFSLESDRVEWQEAHEITAGEHQFKIPLDKGLKRHDVYLSATLISTNNGMPRRYFSVMPVKLDRQSRQLTVDVDYEETLLPLEPATFTVTLPEATTQPAWVTLSLVDKGIINLARYKVPNINDWFFAQRRYSSDVIDLYSRIYQQRPDSFLTHRYGGDAALDSNAQLDDTVESKTITIMSDVVQFDDQGKAQLTVDIPDYNGQAQVVATVFSADQYGYFVSDVDIVSPIVAELAVPRFLAPGDSSQTLLELFNQSGSTQQVTATVSGSEQLMFTGKQTLTATLKDGQRQFLAVPFDITKDGKPYSLASLAIEVSAVEVGKGGQEGERFTQYRDWTIPVRVTQPVISNKYGLTLPAHRTTADEEKPFTSVTSKYWSGLQKSSNSVATVSFSRTPQINVVDHSEDLFRYPYGCAEQTTSKAFPWLLQDASLAPLKKQQAENKTEREVLEAAVLRLATMQKANGSFAMWNKHGEEQPWISVYVTEFLWEASQQYPHLVPQTMLEKALKNIVQYPQRSQLSSSRYYAAWLGAKTQRLEYTTLWQLDKFSREKGISAPLSAAYLGGAFLLHGAQPQANYYFNQVTELSRTNRHNRSRDYDYGSTIRDYAKIVTLLSELEQVITLSDELQSLRNEMAERIVNLFAERRYLSTQEQTSLVQAGVALNALNQQPVSMEVSTGDNEFSLLNAMGSGLASVKKDGTIVNPNDHDLYVQVMTKGLADPQAAESTLPFYTAVREYRRSDGTLYKGEALNIGDKLIVTVRYKLRQTVKNAMLVEYLPTGFVLENPDRTDSADLILKAELKPMSRTETLEYRNDRLMAAFNANSGSDYQFNYVIRAETPGNSAVPALYLEDMYQPEKFIYEATEPSRFFINEVK